MSKKLTFLAFKLALVATLGLALTFTFSCSGDDGGNDNASAPVRKEKISGVSQKGPFIGEADVIIYELDANRNKTKKSFPGKTEGDGSFDITINGTLASPYILLEVRGIYINEVSGEQSDAPITLYAVADVSEKDKVNINVFTHLEYNVLDLASNTNTPFSDVKKAAQRKVLKALGMNETNVKNSEDMTLFGGSASDSILLVASIMLQGDRSATEEVSNLLATIGSEIKDNGTLSTSTKSAIADGVAKLDMSNVAERIRLSNPGAKVPSLEDINNIVEEINGTFTDIRDSIVYRFVKIGNQTWMAENLNYDAQSSKCYNRNETNCTTYGRLYNLETAISNCPSGWHLPSNDEWAALVTAVGGTEIAGIKLKATSSWNDCDYGDCNGNPGGGTNDYGFSALPGGGCDPNGNFYLMRKNSYWWSTTKNNIGNAYFWYMGYDFNGIEHWASEDDDIDDNDTFFSVRCVKN
jgi:uncharacterized protein (TIGR02145 family)